MQSSVLALGHYFQVGEAIVQRIAVNMMDYLVNGKSPSKMFLNNVAMFTFSLAVYVNKFVAFVVYPPTFIQGVFFACWVVRLLTGARAVLPLFSLSWRERESCAALRTNESNWVNLSGHSNLRSGVVSGALRALPDFSINRNYTKGVLAWESS